MDGFPAPLPLSHCGPLGLWPMVSDHEREHFSNLLGNVSGILTPKVLIATPPAPNTHTHELFITGMKPSPYHGI